MQNLVKCKDRVINIAGRVVINAFCRVRIQNYPFCMIKDRSEYYVDKVTEYIKKHVSKDKVKWKIQQTHQNKSFKATERKKHDHVIKKGRTT